MKIRAGILHPQRADFCFAETEPFAQQTAHALDPEQAEKSTGSGGTKPRKGRKSGSRLSRD